jgi:hypothetical protein
MAFNLLQGREAEHSDMTQREMVIPWTLEIRAAKELNGKRGTSHYDHALPGNCHEKLMLNCNDSALVRGAFCLPSSKPERGVDMPPAHDSMAIITAKTTGSHGEYD